MQKDLRLRCVSPRLGLLRRGFAKRQHPGVMGLASGPMWQLGPENLNETPDIQASYPSPLWKRLERCAISPSEAMYNAVLSVAAKNAPAGAGGDNAAERWLQRMDPGGKILMFSNRTAWSQYIHMAETHAHIKVQR